MDTMNVTTIRKNLNNNTDLDKTLEQLAIKQQYNHYKVSLYDLLFNYITFLEMINEDEKKTHLKMDKESEEMIAFVISLFKYDDGLRSYMHGKDDLLIFRNKLESKIIGLTSYADQVQIYEYIMNRIEGRFIQDYYDLEDDDSFAGNLIRFIFEDEDKFSINNRMQLILSQLPVRITKNKFYDYVENSLEIYKGAYIRDLNNYVKMLKDSIIPKRLKEYEASFEAIRQDIDVLEKTDYKNMNQQEFEHINKVMIDLSVRINEMMSVYTLAVSLINNLIELSLCDQFDAFSDEKDLLKVNDLLQLISNKEGFIIDEELSKALEDIEGVIEESMDDVNRYNPLFNMVMEKYQKQLKKYDLQTTFENIEKIDYMSSTSSYFMNPNKMFIEEDDQQVDDFTLAKVKKDFIQTIDEHIRDKSREYRRAIMGHLFNLLPVSFKSPQEFHGYIINALQQCSDVHEKNASKELVRQIMDDLSY